MKYRIEYALDDALGVLPVLLLFQDRLATWIGRPGTRETCIESVLSWRLVLLLDSAIWSLDVCRFAIPRLTDEPPFHPASI